MIHGGSSRLLVVPSPGGFHGVNPWNEMPRKRLVGRLLREHGPWVRAPMAFMKSLLAPCMGRRFPTCIEMTMKRFATLAAACMGTSLLVHGQQSITAIGSAVNQDFNGMGTSTSATLPTGWRVGSDWASGTTTTSTALGTSGTGAASATSTSAGAINWAYGTMSSTTDRALGFRNGNTSTGARNLVYAFKNDTAATIRSINLGWKYEKYQSLRKYYTGSLKVAHFQAA